MSELLTTQARARSVGHGARAVDMGPTPIGTRSWRQTSRLLRVMVALVGCYLLVLVFGGGTSAAAAMTHASFAVFPAMAAAVCLVSLPALPVEQRRTWRLIALASAVYACGGLVWLSYGVRGQPVPVPSWGEVGFLGYVLPLAAALLVLPIATRSRLARLEVLLDCAVIFGAVLFCVWVQVVEPIAAQAGGLARLEMLTLYAYPLVDVLLMAIAAGLLMRLGSREVRSWLPLVLGLLLIAAGDLIYVSLVASNTYNAAAAYNGIWAVAFLLIALTPQLGMLSQPAGDRLTVVRALLPYAALAAMAAVGLGERIHPDEHLGIFVLACAVLTIAAARQVVVVLVKTRLADHLESEVTAATAELHSEREFLAAVVDSLHAGVIACDRTGTITLFNRATSQFHSDPDLARVQHWKTDLHGAEGTHPLPFKALPLMRALAGERVEDVEFMIVPPDAPALALTASGRALHGPGGEIVGAVVAMHDVTERRRQQQALERRAWRDELTGLRNRGAFTAEVSARLEAGAVMAVLLLDLDDFKNINDSLGHDVGDQCLVGVARRIARVLGSGGEVFRLGGDEFVIVIDPEQGDPTECALSVLDAVAVPVRFLGIEVTSTASIGLVTSGTECSTPRELLQAADLAMYVVKSGGRNGMFTYQNHMRGEAQGRLALEADLRNAISNGELHLQYQPIVDLTSGKMTAAEALVRWNHPERGPVSPVEFIPIAEQSGLIMPLGAWVLQQACAQLLLWDGYGGDQSFRVTVNISTRQLERPGLLDLLDDCLRSGVHPSRLVLEVTETALTLDSDAALRTMHEIRARGVQLAVDDFGTGYSSLSRLRSAPVSRIKIDRSFVSEITDVSSDVPIVEATMAMARGLGMGVIAEGIETAAQLAYLSYAGCPEAQGYLFSRPLDPDALLACMTTRPWAAVLPAAAPIPATSSDFQRLVTLAADPQITLEQLVRPLLTQLHAATGLAMTYLTRVQADDDAQEVTFLQSTTPGPIREGLVVPWSESLCKRALEEGPRRTSDPSAAFAGSPVVEELGLSCYIVEPVRREDGTLYGTLCGASTESRALNESDSATLRIYARLIEQKLSTGERATAVGAQRAASTLDAQRQCAAQLWPVLAAQLLAASASPGERQQCLHGLDVADGAAGLQRKALSERDDEADDRLRVVIADDQQLLREVLGAIISGSKNLRVVGAADSAWSTVGVVAAEQPDILVLDYDLGDAPASDVIEHIRLLSPGTRVLLHSARSDVHQLGQQMQVDRVVHKGADPARLPEVLRTLAE